jgi:hypothetical protein
MLWQPKCMLSNRRKHACTLLLQASHAANKCLPSFAFRSRILRHSELCKRAT